jgi:hypothetical protein
MAWRPESGPLFTGLSRRNFRSSAGIPPQAARPRSGFASPGLPPRNSALRTCAENGVSPKVWIPTGRQQPGRPAGLPPFPRQSSSISSWIVGPERGLGTIRRESERRAAVQPGIWKARILWRHKIAHIFLSPQNSGQGGCFTYGTPRAFWRGGVFHIRNTRAFWRGGCFIYGTPRAFRRGGVFHIRNTPGLLARGVFHIRNTLGLSAGGGVSHTEHPGLSAGARGFVCERSRPLGRARRCFTGETPRSWASDGCGYATSPIPSWPFPRVARSLFPGASERSGVSGFRAVCRVFPGLSRRISCRQKNRPYF